MGWERSRGVGEEHGENDLGNTMSEINGMTE